MLQVRQANEEGVTKVNQWHKASQERTTSSNLTDVGWVAVRIFDHSTCVVEATPTRTDVGGREVIVKACGVAMTKLQGHSWAPHLVNGRE